jgi:spoIIIJ-associated protein
MSENNWSLDAIRPRLDQFLHPLLKAARLELKYEVVEGGGDQTFITPDFTVSFEGKDVDLLLNQKGELLLAIEELTLEALRIAHEDRFRIVFDAQDYRLLRIAELRLSAETAAEKVKRTGLAFRFNPMTSRERRIIHLALRDDPGVRTVSEGVAPRRHTVIYAAGSEPRQR